MPATSSAQRVHFLDGLRGVAIALVVLYHTYARWPDLMPFGGKFTHVWLFANGWLGVQLFFLISGFVIFMTLERSSGFADFCFKRWLRLFPAMLVCSLLIWLTAPIFSERPGGIPSALQLLPGLTFIDEDFFIYLGWRLEAIEGVFWSLFVEVKLYLVAGLVYFRKGRSWAIGVLLAVFGVWLASVALANLSPSWTETRIGSKIVVLIALLSSQYFGWFAAGALFHGYYKDRLVQSLLAGIVVAIVAAVTTKGTNVAAIAMSLMLIAIFVAPLLSTPLQGLLAHRVVVFLGYVSYPLYLFHEGIIVALLIKLGKLQLPLPDILLPVLPLAFVVGSAWLVVRFVEPWIRQSILTLSGHGGVKPKISVEHRH